MRGNWATGMLGLCFCALAVLGVRTSAASSGAANRMPRVGDALAADPRRADPLHGWVLFRSENTPAAADAAYFRARGSTHDAQLMERISSQPIATWLTSDATRVERQVRALTTAANGQRAASVIVAYGVPGRSCGEGAGSSSQRYVRWIGEIAAGIGRRHTVVILEPDAVPFAVEGCPIDLELLADAVEELSGVAGARVYVDAGNPSWVTPPSLLVAALRAADVGQAAGFSLNVSNFQTDAANIAYGRSLSRMLGGVHFVIDTSRNGNGPETGADGVPVVCDPQGRALGLAPTTTTGVAGLDAYLWVKPPGSSDGSCRRGAPPSGAWWPQYALELAAGSPVGSRMIESK
jgi:endoglucanase